ncbi:MAG: hypothetical protein H7067_18590 [Burkholderiales bacterium]|nr:hypothetical protein [Opitutaceae bacterium]
MIRLLRMGFHRAVIAILPAVTRINTVLHVSLEANGWRPEYAHHAAHLHSPTEQGHFNENTHSHPQPTPGDDGHEPI